MSRVTWGAPSERYFETGVDRGVLYPNSDTAIAWTGLTAVNETTRGGEPRPTYIDGIKIRNLASKEEYEATIEAFTAPREFDLCDGRMEIQKGLIATNQRRKAFGFSYRTRIGNALDGPEHGYKIHLVYNAMAGPSERNHATIGDSTEAETLSWPITTRAPFTSGIRPTAHFVIDTRYTPKGLLAAVENMLYGNDVSEGRLPLISELITMFKDEGPLLRTNLARNPAMRRTVGTIEAIRNYAVNPAMRGLTGGTSEVRRNLVLNPAYKAPGTANAEIRRNLEPNPIGPSVSAIGSWQPSRGTLSVGAGYLRLTVTDALGGAFSQRINHGSTDYYPVAPNDYVTVSYDSRSNTGSRMGVYAIWMQSDKVTAIGSAISGGYTTVNDTTFTRVSFPIGVAPAGAAYLVVYLGGENAGGAIAVNEWMDFAKVLVERATVDLGWFDGSTAAGNDLTYSWVGTVNQSASIATGTKPYVASFQGYTRQNWTGVGAATDGTNTCKFYPAQMASGLILFSSDAPPIVQNDYVTARFRIRVVGSTTDLVITPIIYGYSGASGAVATISNGGYVTVPKTGDWVDVILPAAQSTNASVVQARLYVTTTSGWARDGIVEVSNVLVEKAAVSGLPWFDGNTAADAANGLSHTWTGTVNLSAAVQNGKQLNAWQAYVGVVQPYQVPYNKSVSGFILRANGNGTSVSPRVNFTLAGSGSGFFAVGKTVTLIAKIRRGGNWPAGAAAGTAYASLRWAKTGGGENIKAITPAFVPDADGWMRVSVTDTVIAGSIGDLVINLGFITGTGNPIIHRDAWIEVSEVMLVDGDRTIAYFDGSTPDANGRDYQWIGAADNSASIIVGKAVTETQGLSGKVYQYIDADEKTWVTTDTSYYLYGYGVGTGGKFYAGAVTVMGPPGTSVNIVTSDNQVGAWAENNIFVIPDSGVIRASLPAYKATAATANTLSIGIGNPAPGLYLTDVLIEEVSAIGDTVKGEYFDGNSPDENNNYYSWAGLPDQSFSRLNSWN